MSSTFKNIYADTCDAASGTFSEAAVTGRADKRIRSARPRDILCDDGDIGMKRNEKQRR